MKTLGLAGAMLAVTALPAAAQAWYDPMTLLHNTYVEVEGGATVQGRTKIDIQAVGLGDSYQSTSHSTDAFGGALIGYKLAPPVAVEAEGFYSRDNLYYSPNNAVFGQGGATRTYGGFGNLRLSYPYFPAYTPPPIMGRVFPITVVPYVSPGIGRGNIQYTGVNGAYAYDSERDGFIFQGKGGIEFKAGEHFGLDIAYRYIQAPNFNHPDNFNSRGYSAYARSSMQVVTAGLKYYF